MPTNFCTKCGQPRASAAIAFCTQCGARLDEVTPVPPVSRDEAPSAYEPVTSEPQAYEPPPYEPVISEPQAYEPVSSEREQYEPPPYEPQAYDAPQYADDPRQGPRQRKNIAIAAAVVAVLAIGGVAGWLATRPSAHSPSAAASHKPTVAPQPTHASAPVSAPSPVQTPSATPTPSLTATTPASTGLVSPAPGVAGEEAEASVQAFLDSYFAAINAHSYRQFRQLLSPRERGRIPRSTFQSGDSTSTDSNAILTGITSISDDELAASVTFTSHQAAADSANDSSCTDWAITLYLKQRGGSYVIYPPPASYRASFGAC